MNEQELLDSLHDAKVLAVRKGDGQVIIELDFVDRWEPQEQACTEPGRSEGHYRLLYVPARLIFEDAEIVAQTGDYTHLEELPDWHAARTILWLEVVGDVYHFATFGDGSLAIRAKAVKLERLNRQTREEDA